MNVLLEIQKPEDIYAKYMPENKIKDEEESVEDYQSLQSEDIDN
jgi:hypothetical protein